MILAFLFLLHCVLVGWVASAFVSFNDSLKKLAAAILLGVLINGFLVLGFSWLLGSLSLFSIILGVLVSSVFVLFYRAKLSFNFSFDVKDSAVILFFVLLIGFFVFTSFQLVDGNYRAVQNVHSDYPFHLGVLNSFFLNNNFPPSYFIFNAPLAYSFFFDFFSAILSILGLEFSLALGIPSVLVLFSLIVFLYFIAKNYSNRKTALIFLALFFFFSSLASINVLTDFASGALQLKDYTNFSDQGLRLINFVTSLLAPQRHFILGAAMVAFLFFVLTRNPSKKELFVAGFVFALLPLSHTASFVVAGVMVAWFFFRKPVSDWLYFIPPCVLLLPQLAWFLFNKNAASLISFQPGWLAGTSLLDFTWFWLSNGWIVLVFGVVGLFLVKEKTRLDFAPFLLFFILANFIRFQPWDWDNTKFFFYAFLALAFFAAVTINKVFSLKPKIVFSSIAVIVLFLGVLAGAHAVYSYSQPEAHYLIFSQNDLNAAYWIVENTPSDVVFLTPRAPNVIVPSLTGRRTILGFEGWVWSHGLSHSELKEKLGFAVLNGDCIALKELGVSYVLFSGLENDYAVGDFTSGFVVVYENPSILKLVC
ncbi:MAG: hypothetical protein ABH803_03645 [Candidatus Micrarchaeota archaeon]